MPLCNPIGYIIEDAASNVVFAGIVDHEHEIEHYFVDDLLFVDIATGSSDGIWLEREELIHDIPGGRLLIDGREITDGIS